MACRLRFTLLLLLASAVVDWWEPADWSALAQAPSAGVDYRRSVEAWRVEREAKLTADEGWLTLVGLYWLEPGVNRVGANQDAEVALPPGSAPGEVGTITFRDGVARFEPARDVDVRINGRPAAPQVLRPQPGDYDVVTTGSVTFFVVKRGNRYGVRVRDANSRQRREFAGLHWFPVREEYRVIARFIPHPTPTSIMIANVLGAVEPWPTPGSVVFTLNGRELVLHPVLDGPDANELFFIFRDGTTGSDTYPGGRFLYAAMPKDGEVILDFNRAENPPCAFTAFATCPLPPKSNTVPIRIEAGELNPHR
jgi:uncharacterized protein